MGIRYVVVVVFCELMVVLMFCGGMLLGLVNLIGVCVMVVLMVVLVIVNRLFGWFGKLLKLLYVVMIWLVLYWLFICWGIVYLMKGIGMWLLGGKIWVRKFVLNV